MAAASRAADLRLMARMNKRLACYRKSPDWLRATRSEPKPKLIIASVRPPLPCAGRIPAGSVAGTRGPGEGYRQ